MNHDLNEHKNWFKETSKVVRASADTTIDGKPTRCWIVAFKPNRSSKWKVTTTVHGTNGRDRFAFVWHEKTFDGVRARAAEEVVRGFSSAECSDGGKQ